MRTKRTMPSPSTIPQRLVVCVLLFGVSHKYTNPNKYACTCSGPDNLSRGASLSLLPDSWCSICAPPFWQPINTHISTVIKLTIELLLWSITLVLFREARPERGEVVRGRNIVWWCGRRWMVELLTGDTSIYSIWMWRAWRVSRKQHWNDFSTTKHGSHTSSTVDMT